MPSTILVTGVSSGIGYVLAKELLEEGHTLIGLSRRKAQALNYDHYECDLSNKKAIEATTEKIITNYKHIDAIIHVAGMGIADALEYTTYDDAEWIYRVNVLAPFYLNRLLIDQLRKSPAPKIIHVGSVAGTITIPFQAFYSMSKAALFSYSEALKMELRPFNIQVAIVLPGDIKTPFTENRKNTYQKNDAKYHQRIERAIKKMAHDEQNGMAPETVTKVIRKLLNKKRLPVYRTVGLNYKGVLLLAKLLPHQLRSKIIYHLYAK